jgi:RNA polymerase sigma-70 factor (ECF subfamily)
VPGRFDERWRGRALAGDGDAVRLLADAALPPLHAFCLPRLGGDRGECEEVVQETLLRALRDLSRYEPARADGEIFGWLTGLARNEIRRVRTRSRRHVSLDVLWERMDEELLHVFRSLDASPLDDAVLEREETRALVGTAMAQLPPRYREALEAKYVAGRSVREMAAALGETEKAVESLLSRSRVAFRATFDALVRHLHPDTAALTHRSRP